MTPKRFWDKVDKNPTCWIWTAAKGAEGYGRVGIPGRRTALAHRVAYEDTNGPIPDGLQIDHICGVRACVNPEHLRAVPEVKNHQHLDVNGHRDAKVPHRGIWFDKGRNKYAVELMLAGERYRLGRFITLDDALAARDAKYAELGVTCY